MRRWTWVSVLGAVLFTVTVVGLMPVSPVFAATTRMVVIDSGDIVLKAASDGTYTAELSIINLADVPLTLEAGIAGDAGSTIASDPSILPPGRRTDLTLTFGAGANVTGGADVTLKYVGGPEPASDVIKVVPNKATVLDWPLLGLAFLIGFACSLAVVLIIGCTHAPSKAGLAKPLDGVGTRSSFQDNWLTTVAGSASGLVALLGGTGALGALLGSEPEKNAVALLTVAGATAAVLVGLSPLLLRIFASDDEEGIASNATVAGTLAAAFVTLGATLGQIVIMTWQAAKLTSGGVQDFAIGFGALVFIIVGSYAVVQLLRFIGLANHTRRPAPRWRNSLL